MKQARTTLKDIVVLYHNGCHDGFSGAWAAWTKFKNKADYIGAEHGKPVPEGLVNKNLYFIDFCYDATIMQELLATNKRLVILDHHISQRDVVGISTEHIYDNERSGSVIAWQHFFPDKAVPKLLTHVQDIDLWRLKVPHTKELMAALDGYPFDFKVWNKLAAEFDDKEAIKEYLKAGKTILNYEERFIERAIRHAEKVEFEGHIAYAVNSPILESEIGNWIVEHKKAIGIIWSYKSGTVRVSLRSNSKTDVSKLAQLHDGGGHKAAAGFGFPVELEFPWKKTDLKK